MALEFPYLSLSSKLGLGPDQPVSPIIHAKQKIFAGERDGGNKSRASLDARAVEGKSPVRENPALSALIPIPSP